MKYPRFLSASLLSGTIIGAGMFSLPFVVRTVGLGVGSLYLLAFAGLYVAIHRMYAGLLETRADGAQFTDLAEAYLPRRAAPVAGWLILIELILVLAVYIILAPSFIELFLPGAGILGAAVFWAIGSVAMYLRTSWLGWAEAAGVAAILAIAFAVLAAGGLRPLAMPVIDLLSPSAALLPFGPLLFAFAGRPAIGKVIELARAARAGGAPFPVGRVIAWGTAFPALVYAAFVYGVLRLAPGAGPDAVTSIAHVAPWLPATLAVLGLITLWTSYVVISVNVKELLEREFRWGKALAAGIAVAAPLALYLIGLREFLPAVSFAGGVLLAIEGIFIVFMWRRAFPNHPWRTASWLPLPVFLAAIAYEIAHLVGLPAG